MGFSGPVDLNHEPVFKWMGVYQVHPDDQEWCFDRVHKMYSIISKKQKEKAEGLKKQ